MTSDHLQPFGPVHPVPIVHFSLEFADAVRYLFQHVRPDAVAVELPNSLHYVIQKGVRRLPEMSVVLYQNAAGQTVYLPIEPTDPIMEAIRSGMEANVPVHFVDLDLDEYPSYRDYIPDTYAAYRLGIEAYYDIYSREVLPRLKKGLADMRRETGMAFRLQELAAKYDKILLSLIHI